MSTPRMWATHAGETGDTDSLFQEKGVIAVGWRDFARMIESALSLFGGRNAALLPLFRRAYEVLVDELKCEAHVKTIYVGFSRSGEMLAAAYPRQGQYFELALRLPDSTGSALLYDAAHLKWPMLPVAVRISDDASFRAAEPLIRSLANKRARGSKP